MQITSIQAADRYLIVRGHGNFDPTRAISLFKEVVEASVRFNRPRVMIDFVAVEGDIAVLTLYEMGVKVSQLGVALTHLALVERPERILPDRFWQNVARNRGLNVLVCANEAEAAAFLVTAPEFASTDAEK